MPPEFESAEARAAHSAFYASTEYRGVRLGSTPWDELHPMWQKAWIAAVRVGCKSTRLETLRQCLGLATGGTYLAELEAKPGPLSPLEQAELNTRGHMAKVLRELIGALEK